MEGEVVGRERELALVDDFLGGPPASFHALVLTGEPGIGKTTLWHETTRRAHERGIRVLATRPALGEAWLSFAGLTDLLEPLDDDALASLPPPQRRALDLAMLRTGGGEPPDERAIAAALLSLLRQLAQAGPLLVAVDDTQWLDRPTTAALTFAVRRLGPEPVGVLAARRVPAERPTFEAAIPEERCRTVSLGPLGPGSLHEVIKRRLERMLPRPLLMRVAAASGGNPFHALEITRELARTGAATAAVPLPAPAGVRELVARRIARLPRTTRTALLDAACLAAPTVELVDPAALAAAEDASVVRIGRQGEIEFEHPLVAAAVYQSASAGARRAAHGRLAGRVDDPEERARHLALSTVGRDERVAAALEEAAASARVRGAAASAAELMAQAIELTPPEGSGARARRTIQLAEDHLYAGDRDQPRELLERVVREIDAGPRRAAALSLLAQVRFDHDSWPEAQRLLEQAFDEAAGDEALRARIQLHLGWVLANNGDLASARLHVSEAAAAAERLGDPVLLGEALSSVVESDCLLGRGVDTVTLERALALEDWSARGYFAMRPSFHGIWCWYCVGDLGRAQACVETMREQLIARGEEAVLPELATAAVWVACAAGDLAYASDVAEQAVAVAGELENAVARCSSLMARATARAHLGELAAARADALASAAIAEEIGWQRFGAFVAGTLGFIAMSEGNADAAEDVLRPLVDLALARGIGEPALESFFLPDAIDALVALGQLDRAEALVALLETRGRELDRPWALAVGGRCRGIVLAARGDLAGGQAAVQEALAVHERFDNPLQLGRTYLALGQIERRRNQRRAARQSFTRARDTFAGIGAAAWAENAGAEAERIGVRRAPTELTVGEQAVAELAAEGLTNREIAAKLFISRRTVEANLARVYTKLGIGSRAELGARVAREQALAEAPIHVEMTDAVSKSTA